MPIEAWIAAALSRATVRHSRREESSPPEIANLPDADPCQSDVSERLITADRAVSDVNYPHYGISQTERINIIREAGIGCDRIMYFSASAVLKGSRPFVGRARIGVVFARNIGMLISH